MAKPIKSLGHIAVTYNGNNITAYLNDTQLKMAISELETTSLASTGAEYAPGFADYTADIPFAKWDATLDGYLYPDVVSPGNMRTCAIAFTDGDDTTVTYTWTNQAFITNYQIGGGAKAILGGSSALRLNGAPTRATS